MPAILQQEASSTQVALLKVRQVPDVFRGTIWVSLRQT